MPRPWAPLPPARWRSPPSLPRGAGEGVGGEGARTAVLSVPALRMRTGFADPGRPDGSGTPDPYRGNGGAATANGTDDRSRSVPPPPSCRGEACRARPRRQARVSTARVFARGTTPLTPASLRSAAGGEGASSPTSPSHAGVWERVGFPARSGRTGHARVTRRVGHTRPLQGTTVVGWTRVGNPSVTAGKGSSSFL